jgi:sigma-E factor negative regulatory protein RseC
MSDKGIVVDVSTNKISVESYRDKPCGLCGQTQGCGNSLWGKLLNHKKNKIQINTKDKFTKGDIVEMHYDEKKLLRFSLIIYFIPLLSVLIFLAFAQYIFGNNITVSIFSLVLGFFAGLLLSRYVVQSMNAELDITVSKI